MLKNRLFYLFALLLAVGLVLGACGTADDEDTGNGGDTENEQAEGGDQAEEGGATDFKVGMVTDVGGVDDKSFNQSAWEGLKAFGEEQGMTEMEGYTYAQSESNADYNTNLNRLVREEYNLIFGIGFMLADAITQVSGQYPDTNFAIVDSVVEADNVASITFQEHVGSFLVGVAAAQKTQSNKVGFIGGVDSELINKFEVGFRAGVASVNPDIQVEVQYAGAFDKADKGKQIASFMYNSGIDVIYHAAGGTGNGVFTEAKDLKKNDPDGNYWVIGVDRDQYEEGAVPDTDDNVTLTSMVKRVDVAVADVATRAMNGEFPGGEILAYGLNDNGIAVAETNKEALTEEILNEVNSWKERIAAGEVEVPQNHDELEAYLGNL